MEVALTMVGERGQAVIPKSIRDKMAASKGTVLAVALVDKDTLVMKRFDRQKLVREFNALRRSIQKKFSEKEILDEIKAARATG